MFDELTEAIEETKEALVRLGRALLEEMRPILEEMRPILEAVRKASESSFEAYSTPKERWLMLHARRRRVRKKYRDRIIRRMLKDVPPEE